MDVITRDQAIERGLSRFFTGVSCKNGHICERRVKNWTCIECSAMWLKQRTPEKNREYQRNWRSANIEKSRAWDRDRYAADPQKRRAYVYAWREANPEYSPSYLQEWLKANPKKIREYTARRRARKLAAEGSHTAENIDQIFKMQRGRCAHPWCRVKLDDSYHVDHIIALSVGGTNWPDNLQILCAPCNHSKSAKDPLDHARSHGMLL
jgi:5-methylcytosine-specific restriction endonuclease McrA